ncbi:hypothetical protein [Lactococcus lactis]|nr:hypothetical protein [Lactococcus lactis]
MAATIIKDGVTMIKDGVRIVIYGENFIDKSMTAQALSLATGIPYIPKPSEQRLLQSLFSKNEPKGLSFFELASLELKKMEERIQKETIFYKEGANFISDGSVLSEWMLAISYMNLDANTKSYKPKYLLRQLLNISDKKSSDLYLQAYGQVAKLHAKEWYSHVIELQEEQKEGLSAELKISLRGAFQNIGLEPINIIGNEIEKIDKIIQLLNLPQILSSKEALQQAKS